MSGKSHIGRYWTVFGALMILTIVTVAVSNLKLAAFLAVALALIIATTKGGLVAAYFMHLVGEHKLIYWVLLLTFAFLLVLLIVPTLVMVGDYSI